MNRPALLVIVTISTPSEDIHKIIVRLRKKSATLDRQTLVIPKRKPEKSIVIVGDLKTQWIRIAYWLASKGCKRLTLVSEQSSSSFIVRHAHILHGNFHTKLKVVKKPSTAAELVDKVSQMVDIDTILVLGQSKLAGELVSALGSRGLKNSLVVSFDSDSSYYSRMCDRWAQDGLRLRAVLGVKDAPGYMSTPLLDWLLTSSAPPVCVVGGPTFIFKKLDISLDDVKLLPTSVSKLRSFGAVLQEKDLPTFRELISRCTKTRDTREIQPFFFIKGIHNEADVELKTLTSDLLCPIIEVTLQANCYSLEATAQSVVEGIQKIQSRGPYNVGGDTIRTTVVMEVARILEEKGQASAVLLLDEDMPILCEELKTLQQSNKLYIHILKYMLKDDIPASVWKTTDWSKLSWRDQVSTALSAISTLDKEHRLFVATALDHAKYSLKHMVEGPQTIKLEHGIVHSFRKGEDYRDDKMGQRHFNHYIPSSKLKTKEIGEVIGQNVATPVLQLNLRRHKTLQNAQLFEKVDGL